MDKAGTNLARCSFCFAWYDQTSVIHHFCDKKIDSFKTGKAKGEPSLNDFKDLPIHKTKDQEAVKICVDIYLCFHVSEINELHEPTKRAWLFGQKIYNENKK